MYSTTISLPLCRTFSESRRYEKVAVNSKRTGVGSTCSRNSSRPGKERTLHFRDLESGKDSRAKLDEQDQWQSARNGSKEDLIDNPAYADPSRNEDLLDNPAYGDRGRNDDNPAYEDLLDTPAYGDAGGNVYIEELVTNPAYGVTNVGDDYAIPQSLTGSGDEDIK